MRSICRCTSNIIVPKARVVPIKILSLNYSDIAAPGGVHTAIRNVSEKLVKRGHQAIVISINPGQLEPFETVNGVELIRVKSPLSKYIHGLSYATYKLLGKNLAKAKPDIIHVHGFHTLFSLEVLYLLRNSEYPLAFSPHYGPESHNTVLGSTLWGIYKHVGKSCFHIADKVICASEFERENVLRDFQVNPAKIEVVPHGVDAIEPRKTRTAKSGISLIYIGWFIELKGVQFILEALRELNTELNANATLTLIGKGDYQQRLIEQARELNVVDAVSWYPPLFSDALHRKLRGADMLLLLSRSENFGIVVAEALAAGVPCIVAHKAALKEFSGEPGCFSVEYPPRIEELARLIVKVHDSNVKVGPFSGKVQTWDTIAQHYDELYTSLLERYKKRARL